MTEADDKKLRQKVYVFMHRRMQRGQQFSLDTDDLVSWIIDKGHIDDAFKRSGLNGIQPVDATAPLSLDNIWFDPEKACRQTSRCAGIKKVDHPKGFPGENRRDYDNYRVLRVNEWIAELRQNATFT
ncbi:hypothetical protein [Agrobacterium vaccinii]|uniref:hypothetical protein n=1 Tax=Agrobacterium vaccinii TaxID=2735528 RepID=UPI001E54815D|nr:hypothetical protein [Agrobacterium vaccinii]UHS56012.1 hypothetical protein HRS00_03890 [Agrobacterium vaccinii]